MLHIPETGYVVDCCAVVHQYNGTAEHGGEQLFSLSDARIMVVPLSSIHSVVGPVVALKEAPVEGIDTLSSSGLVQPFKEYVRQFYASYKSYRSGRSPATERFHMTEVFLLRKVLSAEVCTAIEIVVEEVLNG
jgi:hypothetical protein